MTIAQAVLGLGIRGKDLILSTFKQVEEAKKKFQKPASSQISGKVGGAGASSQESKQAETEKKETKQTESFTKALKNTENAIKTVGGGFASLNPASFLSSVVSGASEVLQEATHALPDIAGAPARALLRVAENTANFGIQAATGALNAYKAALPVAAERIAQKSILKFSGVGETQGIGANQASVSRAEAASLAQALYPALGKLQQGSEMEKQLVELFRTQNGTTVNRTQANQLAQGDFSALGNTKGFLLNQISQSFAGLPPEIAQVARASMLKMVDKNTEVARESAGTRETNVAMESADLELQDNIAGLKGMADVMAKSNATLNGLQLTMVTYAANFNSALASAIQTLNKAIGGSGDTGKASQGNLPKGYVGPVSPF